MQRTISSAQTFFIKVIFPVIWISGFGLGTAAVWLGEMHGKAGVILPAQIKWLFLTMWSAGTTLVFWLCARLKRVQLDESRLTISNYFRGITVPLNQISNVTENRWINIHPVTIHFRKETDFGSKITFMPTVRWFGLWSPHPIVAELMKLRLA